MGNRKIGMMAWGAAAIALLAGCQEAGENYEVSSEQASSADMAMAESVESAEAETSPSGDMRSISAAPDIPVSLPKIAYVFDYGFRLPGKDIPALQQKHADMCEAQGPYTCRILTMAQNGEPGEYTSGTLQLAVASDKARAFGTKLGEAAEAVEAEATGATIAGEDLSKAIVDTEARLRSRVVLRDRLLEVLQTRRGTVAELVEAERSVARVNEEIDQARSWLEEMRTRVAYSRVNIAYESGSPGASGFVEPIGAALASVGSILGTVIAGLILFGTVAIPFALLVWIGLRLRRRFSGVQLETA